MNVHDAPVEDTPRVWLRLEGFTVLLLAAAAYRLYTPDSWSLFAVLFLLPDLSMIGYAANSRLGALLYNSIHTYVAPAMLGTLAVLWLGRPHWRSRSSGLPKSVSIAVWAMA